MRTTAVYVLALAALAAAYFIGYPELYAKPASVEAERRADKDPIPVVVAIIARAPFVDTMEALGTVRANESVEVTANRADHVSAIHFDDGQLVEKGDLLVELHSKEERAALAEALAVRDDRQTNHGRAKELFDEKLTSQREYEAHQQRSLH